MFVILSFLLIFHLSFDVSALGWRESSRGYIPSKAIVFNSKTMNNLYFCRTLEEKNGKNFIGTVREGEKACSFLHNGEIKKSHFYQILTLHKPGETFNWSYKGRWTVPEGAVSCGNDCYLGHSLYSDGICTELIGKISPKDRMIYMINKNEVTRCPFFIYLASNEKEIFNLDPIKQAQKVARKRMQNRRFNPSWWGKYSWAIESTQK